ncbi:uncharacterized protein LOC132794463 [Drosophila nasuta]|uniref:uncharacterized protein LOC132794463 n=1 Tax=Drosophila nasuta TaxID=42062 RepID=UPI00295ECEF4|nr:uncharacterized protein LOC132794463 [Drosophila nasuta]
MVNDSYRLHSRQVVGGFPDAAANGLLEEQQPPPQMPVDVDMEKQLKGQRIMDALLGIYTTEEKGVEHPDAAANGLLEKQPLPPQMPVDVDIEKQLKGQRIIDALLGIYTTNENAVGGFPGAAANSLLEEQQPPPQMPIDVDMEKQLKGQRIMDALLGFYTT